VPNSEVIIEAQSSVAPVLAGDARNVRNLVDYGKPALGAKLGSGKVVQSPEKRE
jgi:hypothetical protein